MMSDDEKQWTRLIDGELSFAEQQAMLATLDEMPNGWKRLALGLLEAEAFRRELRSCVPSEPIVVAVKPASAKLTIQRVVQAALVSVIGLVCLGLGMGIEQLRQPAAARIEKGGAVATTFQSDDSDDIQTQQTLKLVFADWPGGGEPVEVPVIEAADERAVELLQQSAVPEALRKKLEANGYVIHEERKYVPVSLENGRQGIAPVSDVVVQYQPVAFQ